MPNLPQTVALLGRQPALGVAELERLYGADNLQLTTQPQAVLLHLAPGEVTFARLGGSVKLGKVFTALPGTSFTAALKHLRQKLPDYVKSFPDGKIRLGLSVYGMKVSLPELNRGGLELKKVIKNAGRSVRVVPNTAPDLNSAQTLHNQLTGPTGLELILIADGDRTWIAQVVAVQDINAYAARDQARPKRDARVGMLPPKLAQIIVNLTGVGPSQTVLDPFCGTGVVLQEALLMGFEAYGTDLEPRMIEYSQTNIEWLRQAHSIGECRLQSGDATDFTWEAPFDVVAAETYLGRAFSSPPDPGTLRQVISDVNLIHKRFLQNVAKQTSSGFCLSLAVPAWKTSRGFEHLPLVASSLDSLEELGYTRMSFAHVRTEDLVYHREGQIVGRELVILQRI